MDQGASQAGGGGDRQPAGLALRVAVVGSPGSGKSTLSRRLAQACGIAALHLDDLYWRAGWQRPAEAEWRAHVTQLASGETWLIDGNYSPTLRERISRAQVVILVDTPMVVCLYRVVRRALRIRAGRAAELPARVRAQAEAGERVSATQDFAGLVRLVLSFRRRREEILSLVAEYAPALVVVGSRPRPADDIGRLVRQLRALQAHSAGLTSRTARAGDGC